MVCLFQYMERRERERWRDCIRGHSECEREWGGDYFAMGSELWGDQMNNLLSFPPLANWFESGDHFKPHTSCLWPASLDMKASFALTSLFNMTLSREPLDKMWLFHAMVPTLAWWPSITRNLLHLATSHISTSPFRKSK